MGVVDDFYGGYETMCMFTDPETGNIDMEGAYAYANGLDGGDVIPLGMRQYMDSDESFDDDEFGKNGAKGNNGDDVILSQQFVDDVKASKFDASKIKGIIVKEIKNSGDVEIKIKLPSKYVKVEEERFDDYERDKQIIVARGGSGQVLVMYKDVFEWGILRKGSGELKVLEQCSKQRYSDNKATMLLEKLKTDKFDTVLLKASQLSKKSFRKVTGKILRKFYDQGGVICLYSVGDESPPVNVESINAVFETAWKDAGHTYCDRNDYDITEAGKKIFQGAGLEDGWDNSKNMGFESGAVPEEDIMFIESIRRWIEPEKFEKNKKAGKLRCPVVCHKNETHGKVFMFGCMGPKDSICKAYKFLCTPQIANYNERCKATHDRYDEVIKRGGSHREAIGGSSMEQPVSSSATSKGKGEGKRKR